MVWRSIRAGQHWHRRIDAGEVKRRWRGKRRRSGGGIRSVFGCRFGLEVVIWLLCHNRATEQDRAPVVGYQIA